MNKFLKSNAWIAAAHSIVFLLLGYNMLTGKSESLESPMQLFSFMIMGLGILIIIFSLIRKEKYEQWWMILILGLIDLGIGIYVFFNSAITWHLFINIIAIFAFATGLSLAYVAFKSERFKALLFINAAISLGFGILIFLKPEMGDFDWFPLLGLYTLILGFFLGNAAWWMHKRKVDEQQIEIQEEITPSSSTVDQNIKDGN